jgi:hypothetical protein
MMRDSPYRPMLRLALFGTYTLIAIGIKEVRARLWDARIPADLESARKTLRTRRGRRRQNG